MTLPVWTTQQILNQLESGNYWAGQSTITYDFPTAATWLTGTTELSQFVALSTTQQAIATLAITLWGDLIPQTLQKITQSGSNTGNIDIAAFNGPGSDYAHTYYPLSGTVWFNDFYNGTSNHGGSTNNLVVPAIGKHGFATYVHELGHAFGLNHSGNYNAGNGTPEPTNYQDSTVYSIMSYFGPSYGDGTDSITKQAYSTEVAWGNWLGYDAQTPMLDDILAIQNAYGVSTTTRTGDTVYGFHSTITGPEAAIYDFNQNAHPVMCLFDSSGNDTLDLSGDIHNDVIDLHSGAFSSVMGMTNNLSIANSCTIENAIGGSGLDILYGNQVANSLAGGSGNDTLYGGDGFSLNAVESSIYRLYQATLDREPDVAGLNYWESAMAGGQSLLKITDGFVNSPEFQQQYGALTNTQFVTLLYNNVLHRAPDSGGLSYWLNCLNTGSSRSFVVDGISESVEFQANTSLDTQAFATTAIVDKYLGEIYRLYEASLHREPDVAGFQNWIQAMENGLSEENLASNFINSPEFQTTYGSLDNTQFVTLLYNNVLHRQPDSSGLAYWVNALDSGSTRSSVLIGFSDSLEFANLTNANLGAFVKTQMAPLLSDTLDGGPGNDTLFGGLGSDIFKFQPSGGTEQVYGLEAWDQLKFSGFGYTSTSQILSHMTQIGQDVVFSDLGESVTFHHTQISLLQNSDGILILA